MKPINLKQKHALFTKHWHPHQIATVDDMQVILAKIKANLYGMPMKMKMGFFK